MTKTGAYNAFLQLMYKTSTLGKPATYAGNAQIRMYVGCMHLTFIFPGSLHALFEVVQPFWAMSTTLQSPWVNHALIGNAFVCVWVTYMEYLSVRPLPLLYSIGFHFLEVWFVSSELLRVYCVR